MSTENLISAVSKRPYLWNRNDGMYRDRDYVEDAWNGLAVELGMSKDAAKTKWKGLRDTFRRELVKKSKRRCSHSKSSWQHYRAMLFLKDQMTHRNKSLNTVDDPFQNFNADRGGSVKPKCEYVVVLEGEHSQEDANKRIQEQWEQQEHRDEYIRSEITAIKEIDEDDTEGDLYFFKSLIPYFKGLKPIEKLLLRTQIQDLVLQHVKGRLARASEIPAISRFESQLAELVKRVQLNRVLLERTNQYVKEINFLTERDGLLVAKNSFYDEDTFLKMKASGHSSVQNNRKINVEHPGIDELRRTMNVTTDMLKYMKKISKGEMQLNELPPELKQHMTGTCASEAKL